MEKEGQGKGMRCGLKKTGRKGEREGKERAERRVVMSGLWVQESSIENWISRAVKSPTTPQRVGGCKGQRNGNSGSSGNGCHLQHVNHEPSSVLSILCALFHLILPRSLCTKVHHYPHFTAEESEASRCWITSQSQTPNRVGNYSAQSKSHPDIHMIVPNCMVPTVLQPHFTWTEHGMPLHQAIQPQDTPSRRLHSPWGETCKEGWRQLCAQVTFQVRRGLSTSCQSRSADASLPPIERPAGKVNSSEDRILPSEVSRPCSLLYTNTQNILQTSTQ